MAREHKRERFTAWITKYALTQGIHERMVEDCFDISPTMVTTIKREGEYSAVHFFGQDWHRTKADAIKRAREMQTKRLESIDQQRARIAALKFD